jgi:3',5'-cyclic AMP phosphodiesterase CpdA
MLRTDIHHAAMFTLAHLSDPHLAPLPHARLSELCNKRALGFINWHRGRKRFHRPEALDAIVLDLKSQKPDHIAVTGDLINLSLPDEYARAGAFMASLGPAKDVTLVPGNHDIYVSGVEQSPAEYWGEYMRGDDGLDGFPLLRRRGNVAIIGLSTALPTTPFLATGRLGKRQIDRFADLLEQARGAFRIVLIHHPPRSTLQRHFKRLTDAAALRRVLADKGAELLLHGHDHYRSLAWLAGPQGKKIPAAGVPSASAGASHGSEDAAAYNLFHIGGESGNWRCEMIVRQRGADGAVRATEQRSLY